LKSRGLNLSCVIIAFTALLLANLQYFHFLPALPSYHELIVKSHDISKIQANTFKPILNSKATDSPPLESFNRAIFLFHPKFRTQLKTVYFSLNLKTRSLWIPASTNQTESLLMLKIDPEISLFLSSLEPSDLRKLGEIGIDIRLTYLENVPTEAMFYSRVENKSQENSTIKQTKSISILFSESSISDCPPATLAFCSLQNSSLYLIKPLLLEEHPSKCVRSADVASLTIYTPTVSQVSSHSFNYVYFSEKDTWHCPQNFIYPVKSYETYFWFNPTSQFSTYIEIS
jgi:hypothetical protein